MRLILLAILFLLAPAVGYAEDVAVPVSAPDGGSLWIGLLGSEPFWNAVAIALTFLIGLLSKMAWVQKAKERIDDETEEIFKAAAIKTYNDSVRKIKAISADRKITPNESAELRDETWQNVKNLAGELKGPGAKAALAMARPAADALMEKIVTKLKRENASPE